MELRSSEVDALAEYLSYYTPRVGDQRTWQAFQGTVKGIISDLRKPHAHEMEGLMKVPKRRQSWLTRLPPTARSRLASLPSWAANERVD